ncbi:acetyltransferase, GNAT family protein [Pseudooceanicola batsensis HTCC2597]|uniref:Acetyltransferase, GNAT family protein n=1 Tax=Pseudooceanicola batsensis (strain ATCC BAA-863 / DSM 15984 / KCTC 12145 / HTCC2597) TaxID=252305 RepID=A3TXG5_PSEBH|nr:GNAT family protein [Pseudooceanicola batsensis]EAQ03525.1 acetyltransferase, GNAT family protein [Pseudooceanicola batsensis HTCC2597]
MEGTMNLVPEIKGDGLVLRPVRRSDSGLIELYGSDDRVARMTTSIPHPLPPGSTDAFVARAMSGLGGELVWVMDASPFGGAELKGLISLERMDPGPRGGSQSEIGYWVAPAWWNTGLASAAVQALVDANPLNDDTLFGSVFQDNPASARVLTNAGFQYVGDAESFSVARNAKVPTWTYIRKLN